MANSLTALNKEEWARSAQDLLQKELVAMMVANLGIDADVSNGDKVHKPYGSKFHTVTYTKGTDISNRQALTATDDYMDIATIEAIPVYYDDFEDLQASYSWFSAFTGQMMYTMKQRLDGVLFSEHDNAGLTIDDGDFSGTASTAHDFTSSDIQELFTVANKKLNLNSCPQTGRWVALGPSQFALLQDVVSARDTSFGDSVGANGYVGNRYGMEIYLSNSLTFTARWTPADNPSNAATLTIAGVTITFMTTPATTTPGSVDIGASTAATLDNLVALLNNSTGYAAEAGLVTSYFNFNQADLAKLNGIVATDGTTYLDIEMVGAGEVVVASSESADLWSLETLHCMAGQGRPTSMVIQGTPGLKVVADPDRLGDNVTAHMLYGIKTFTEDAQRLIDVNVDASGFSTTSRA